ncbi:ROK family transcriptional regulator [Thermotoga profunda]|uniref:ROK family transcriptional regulator n=1 Tax=Thermotoga profunda TaxID=1508420 RepID=UPI000597A952|nr:ROK family transcriptional regulator [Thermotoga profunda]
MKYNSPRIKVLNKQNILKLIHENHPISRAEISIITDLTPSSVTRLTKELIDDGYIREKGTIGKNSPGRRRMLLDLNKNASVSLVFDLGVNVTTFGLGYFDGKVDLGGSFETPKHPKEFFKKVKEIYSKMQKERKITRISFSIPGMVNMVENRILLAPNLHWQDISINEFLDVDIPILADNEANLSMMAEKYHSKDLKEVKEAVFIVIREGVGTGVLLDGKIYRGPSFTAGEAGHMTVDIRSDKKCHCSNEGCWELVASINWAIKSYQGELQGKNAIEKFSSLKRKKDSRKILEDFAKNIAIGIVNIVNIINPQLIILGGEVQDLGEYFYNSIEEEVKKRALRDATRQLRIRPTIFETVSSNLVGAAVLAIEDIIEKVK